MEEYRKDYQLLRDLAPIARQVEALSDSLKKTMTALASDTWMESVEIYNIVRRHASLVPGLDAAAKELSVCFARHRGTADTAKPAGGS